MDSADGDEKTSVWNKSRAFANTIVTTIIVTNLPINREKNKNEASSRFKFDFTETRKCSYVRYNMESKVVGMSPLRADLLVAEGCLYVFEVQCSETQATKNEMTQSRREHLEAQEA